MSNVLTLGSLFSGSGGFELAGLTVGMKPLWASEVEPFTIRVTSKRLPFVAHMGDVRNLDGANLPPVDIITFGSPCQDLSIAGKRSGIEGSRSSLFYEAIRIIKEMRWKTNGNYPKYALWENVPGAFSSHKGADFEKVLEAFLSVKGYTLDAPRPQKWHAAGEIVADHFSLSWRVLDAQHFGVPQRRKRIFLSQILETHVPEKYYLSPRACSGILRRAKTKGKDLPEILREALMKQAGLF